MTDVASTPTLTPERALGSLRMMLEQLPVRTGYSTDDFGQSMQSVRWQVRKGYQPLVLEVRIIASRRIVFISLNCTLRISKLRRSEGRWEYLLKPAIFGTGPLMIRAPHTLYRSLKDLRADLEADITMYLDGSYKASQVRPRSSAGMPGSR